MIRSIEWNDDRIVMIDQRLLPTEEVYNSYRTPEEVADAIRSMVIRGAPAIGVAAAMGLALGIGQLEDESRLEEEFDRLSRLFAETRPTARNLFWALQRMRDVFQAQQDASLPEIQETLRKEAEQILEEDITTNRRIGEMGQRLLTSSSTVLTHCNTGSLATGGYGTALGIVRSAVEHGKQIQVLADETRPFLQGSRLTAWEMRQEEIPCTLITDSMAGHFMARGRVNAVVVGADRIARNGDVVNKIGTYSLAVLADAHSLPFYVAAPLTTIDLEVPSGEAIPIEERAAREVTEISGRRLAPEDMPAENPAFDVTPARLVSAIITDVGIARAPYEPNILDLFQKKLQV